MKNYNRHEYYKKDPLYYSDRYRVRMECYLDYTGKRVLYFRIGYQSVGMIDGDDELNILMQLEDYDIIIKALSGKRYKTARRWFLKVLREKFSFRGHNISEFLRKDGVSLDFSVLDSWGEGNYIIYET